MLSVGYDSRHAMWRYPHAGSVTQYRRLKALTMENCANYISTTMQTITRASGQVRYTAGTLIVGPAT